MRVNYRTQLWFSRIDGSEVWITAVPALCFSSLSSLLYLVCPSPPPRSLCIYLSFPAHLNFFFPSRSFFFESSAFWSHLSFLYSPFITINFFLLLCLLLPFSPLDFSSLGFLLFHWYFTFFLFLEEPFYLHFNFSLPFSVALLGFFSLGSLQGSRGVLHMEGAFD